MKAIHLMGVEAGDDGPAGTVPIGLLDRLAAELARIFRVSCHVRTERLEMAWAYDAARRQYHSTAVLQHMTPLVADGGGRLLGVTAADLYVPILTFVFGEAQLTGPCALVSLHRLREEFYGLPPDPHLLLRRATIEAVHELGHTFGLRHCADWRCAMASTHAVERLDLKEAAFCCDCAAVVEAWGAASSLP